MKEVILDIAKKIYHNHLTPETGTDLILSNFGWQIGIPQKEGRYIVAIDYIGTIIYTTLRYDKRDGFAPYKNVVAWMPIPPFNPQGGGE